MPKLYQLKCDHCGFDFEFGSGAFMYVTDDKGVRHYCSHPMEHHTIAAVLGDDASAELIKARTGIEQMCFCNDCQITFYLDLHRDKHLCPQCQSNKGFRSVKKMAGKTCPFCMTGIIQCDLIGWS